MPRSSRGRAPAAALSGVAAALCALAAAGCGGHMPLAALGTPPAATAPVAARSAELPPTQPAQQPTPADASLAGLHACALIPAATVGALGTLGEPAAPSSDGLTCFYNVTGGLSYIVSVFQRSRYELTKTIDVSEAQAGLVQLTRTHGLGDEGFAISSTSGGPAYELNVAKGGLAVAVTLDSVEPASEYRANQLVAAALAGL